MMAHPKGGSNSAASQGSAVLSIRNLRKEYRPGQPVLKNISLDIGSRRVDRDHWPIRHRQINIDPLHQPAG